MKTLILFLCAAFNCHAGDVLVSWDAEPVFTDGFRVVVREASGMVRSFDAGLAHVITIPVIPGITYYFSVVAYNAVYETAGDEIAFATSKNRPPRPPHPRATRPIDLRP